MTDAWTIGHSTRTFENFLDALRSFQIQTVADIRRFPTSRRHPHFSAVEFKKSLFRAGIQYAYWGDELGGMRKTRPDSRHVGLKGSGFQGYADWMETPTFRVAITRLLPALERSRTALVCAERPPSGCHRSLLADHLALMCGVRVSDILDPGVARDHLVTPGVRKEGEGLIYAGRPEPKGLDAFDASSR